MSAAPSPTPPALLADGTGMGPVFLAVADLERSIDWYGSALGLAAAERAPGMAVLGAPRGRPLLALIERPRASSPPAGATGLFHVAILLPDRAALGAWLRHATSRRLRIDGASDHAVSEAVYLSDPDGHGLEIYRDRPRAEWRRAMEQVHMTTVRLDTEAVLAAAADQSGYDTAPAATVVGHVHLKVADLTETRAFHVDGLGFALQAERPGALFISAGGYHHHLGLNVWESRHGAAPPPGSLALVAATIELEDAGELAAARQRLAAAGHALHSDGDCTMVADPAGNRLLLRAGQVDVGTALGLAQQLGR